VSITKSEITQKIKAEAQNLGFFRCGIAPFSLRYDDMQILEQWLTNGFHAGMSYMERNHEVRQDIQKLVENAKSVIVVLQPYFTDLKPAWDDAPILSKYAYGADYHFVVKDKLSRLLEIIRRDYPATNGRFFTDSAPIFERRWAQLAGLGWIGKNGNLIARDGGSFFFIGELILDIELDYDLPFEQEFCGTCNRCLQACPTQAIVSPRVINSNLCISYNTIELKGDIPEDFKGKFQNRVFGCDICQDVCPWNRKALKHKEKAFEPNPGLLQMTKEDWQNLSETKYKEIFKRTPVDRVKYRGIKRNIDFIS
jgi:epoxyqueuosine reductase